jgi:Neprosin
MLRRLIAVAPITSVIVLAGIAPSAQALPPGVRCVAATAENQLTPPPPVWVQKHEPKPAHLPAPLCPSGSVPTPAARPADAPPSTSLVAPITSSPKQEERFTADFAPPKPREGYPAAPFYYAGDGYHTPEAWYGLSTGIQVGNPKMSAASGTHSLGQIAVATPNVEYTAELGWHRDEGFGAGSRLFTYINKDKYTTNGKPGGDCYNCIIPQEGSPYTLNQELEVGRVYQFTVDHTGGAWWFAVGPTWIGHENDSFWSSKFKSSTWLIMYGEVYDPTGPNSQMGNGIIGTKTGSLVMNNPYLYGEKGELFTTAGHKNQEKDPYPSDLPAYSVGLYSTNEREWHYGGE